MDLLGEVDMGEVDMGEIEIFEENPLESRWKVMDNHQNCEKLFRRIKLIWRIKKEKKKKKRGGLKMVEIGEIKKRLKNRPEIKFCFLKQMGCHSTLGGPNG